VARLRWELQSIAIPLTEGVSESAGIVDTDVLDQHIGAAFNALSTSIYRGPR